MGNSRSKMKKKQKAEMSAAQFLVNGYIRQQIEPLITHWIIPDSINNICWMYYDFNHRKLIFCVNTAYSDQLYFTYIDSSDDKAWTAKFWNMDFKINNNMGICSTTGLTKYPKIFSKYNDIWANITIFVCGHGEAIRNGSSYTNKCYCSIFVDTNILANAENEKS